MNNKAAFKIADDGEALQAHVMSVRDLAPALLAFKDDNKWRLYDGSSIISVKMADHDFLHQVDNNLISFSKGDILICKVKAIQYRTDNGLKTEHEVIKIKEHKAAARQLSLFDGSAFP